MVATLQWLPLLVSIQKHSHRPKCFGKTRHWLGLGFIIIIATSAVSCSSQHTIYCELLVHRHLDVKVYTSCASVHASPIFILCVIFFLNTYVNLCHVSSSSGVTCCHTETIKWMTHKLSAILNKTLAPPSNRHTALFTSSFLYTCTPKSTDCMTVLQFCV